MQGGAPQPAGVIQPAPKGTGLVVGQVVDADSGRPIPGVMVSFTSNLPATPEEALPGAVPQTRRVIANGEGRFMFHSVAPGRVSLSAQAASYIPASPGQRRPSGPSQPLMLAEDERVTSVTIRMWKYAAVEGRVIDENNEPVVGTQVRVWRREWAGGRLRMTPGLNSITDDRGAFRIGQLPPGDYYVSVPSTQMTMPISLVQKYVELQEGGRGTASTDLSRQLSASAGPQPSSSGQRIGDHILQISRGSLGLPRAANESERLFVYPAVFEPNLEQEPIRLGSGEQRQGVLVAIRPVPGVKVSGVLTGPEGPVAHVGVQLVRPVLFGTSSPLSGTDAARTATDANGAFTFLGVPGDKYKLSVMYVPRPAPTEVTTVVTSGSGGITTMSTMGADGAAAVPTDPTLYAEMDLTVNDEDVTGLNVPVRLGARLSGTVAFEGVATPPTPEQISRISISVRPASGATVGILTPGRVDAEMKIRTIGYPAGRYFLTASVPAPGWSLASAMVGSRDVTGSGIELGDSDINNLVLTFSDKRTQLTGTVRAGSATGDPEAIVLAIPSDVKTWIAEGMNPRLMSTVRTSPTGMYTISGLLSGDYRVMAMSEDFAVDTRDPAFLTRLVQLGTSISLREGEKRTLDLRTETPPRRAPAPVQPAPVLSQSAVARSAHLDSAATGGPFVSEVSSDVQQAPARDATSVVARGTAVISGTVVADDADKKPIRKVQVSLMGSALRPSPVTLTDDAGRFLFIGLPAGRYTLMASRPPYVDTYYGAKQPGLVVGGTTLALTEGQQVTGLTVPMVRGAVIEGTVLNEFGLPEAQAQVTLLQQRPGADGPQMVIAGGSIFSSTDDRGQYRAYGLPPGEYLVAVRPGFSLGADLTRITDADMRWANAALNPARTTNPPPPASQPIATVPVYHPGVVDLANARPVKLAAAEERTGVDITLVTVPAARVQGRVITPDGQRPNQLQMNMLPEGPRVPLVSPTMFVRPTSDGSFQLQGVAPGRYTITARAASRPPGAPASPPSGGRGGGAPTLDLWAIHTVEVNGQDVTGISMTLAPGLNVRGQVVFEKTTATPPEKFGGVSVRISPALTTGVSLGVPPATVAEDGTFTIAGVIPNGYRVAANAPGRSGQGPMWMLKSVVHGGRDVSDAPLVVTPDADVVDVVVTLTDRVTEITGLLLDSAGPAPEFTILVFPVDKTQWGRDSRRRPPPTRPGTDGRYRLTAVAPGEYYIVAASEISFDEMYDVTLLESLIPSAIKLSLAEGEKKVQDFKLAGR